MKGTTFKAVPHRPGRIGWTWRQCLSTRALLLTCAMFICVGVPCWMNPARSQAVSRQRPKPTDLAPVVVTGAVPGPMLWKVSAGDHVLWILGVAEPLPKNVAWNSEQVERIIANSQEVIGPVKAKAGIEADLGQAIDMRRARKLSDGRHLVDVIPPDSYARWLELKAKYVGKSEAIERLRPRFAAKELYEYAYKRLNLTLRDDVWRIIKRLARKHDVPIKVSRLKIVVENSDADETIAKLGNATVELDMPCFERTLAALDDNARKMVDRANAWAEGDIRSLRNVWVSPQAACSSILTHMPGIADYQVRLVEGTSREWANDADAALKKNRTSFGVQPIASLLQADGVLTILRSRGYVVEEPR